MKKGMIRIMLIAVLVMATPALAGVLGIFSLTAQANAYTISSYPTRPGWSGGPFLINGNIVTYCLEINEYLSFGVQYFGTINDYAIKGGVSGNVNGIGPASQFEKDYLDRWSEWLIANFLSDSLTSEANMKNFQEAIWFIEGERPSLSEPIVDSNGTNYYTLAKAADPTFDYPWIQVLNLFEYNAQGQIVHKQSLFVTPEPFTLLLLGLGLLGVAGIRRKI